MYYTKLMSFRLTQEVIDAIEELLEKYPDLYKNGSQVVRCAINELINDTRRSEENELKGIENKRAREEYSSRIS